MLDGETAFEDRIRSLLADGQKIEAIKLYREHTGAGLAEAKGAVEALEQGEPLPKRPASGDSSAEWDVVALLEQGRKIEAIKLYRERTGVGLKQAKEAVETMASERGLPGGGGGGCFGVLLVVATIAAGVAAALS
jgi:ribosomal protein L7/L12